MPHLPRVALWLSLCCSILGCEASDRPREVPADSGAPTDAGAPDAAIGRWTMVQSYRCCFQGEGTSCCEGTKPGSCYAYGGHLGDCVGAGGEFDGKEECVVCCPDTERRHVCDAPPSIFICVSCGAPGCSTETGGCAYPDR